MTKQLTYGAETIKLADDQDLGELVNKISRLLGGTGGDPWFTVKARNGAEHTLLITPGVHLHVTEAPPARASSA